MAQRALYVESPFKFNKFVKSLYCSVAFLHHCRCCGRTLCAEHLANQMVLPQFAIHSPVRICADCFNDAPRYIFTRMPSKI
ncbi:PREDICTED: vacuolar protein sorting-associated protein 27-like [Ipomoea nil]|uniref:vacuolar protein sorting-associated protein 27-like n=1 Tax=Ipomoea nil TaxID=35883 RepID=UPI000901A484|nr:PREDICTED: vacuolar protein sorting-associated protein 27-like [Ipomoea nil]